MNPQPPLAERNGENLATNLHELRTPLDQVIGFGEMLLETALEEGVAHLSQSLSGIREAGLEISALFSESGRLTLTMDGGAPLSEALLQPIHRIRNNLDAAFSDSIHSGRFRMDLEKIGQAVDLFVAAVSKSPIRVRPEGQLVEPVDTRASTQAQRRLAGRILIVDDEVLNREILIRRLQREGCDPVGVISGKEALDILETEAFEAVLLDIVMPDLSGIEVLQIIKGTPRLYALPVIMLSALTDVESVARCLELGAEDYLPKPVNATLLRARLGACLERKRLLDQDRANLQALHEEKERLSVTLRSLADAVISTDAGGRIVLFNDVAATMTGKSAEQVAGRPFEEIFSLYQISDGRPAPSPAYEAMARNLVVDSLPGMAFRTADGSERLMATRSAPIHDQDGLVTGTVVVLRDITEQEKMADELLRASKLQSIGLLAGGLAHDFNNMLTTVLGNLSLLRHRRDVPPAVMRITASAEHGAMRAKELTQYLLTFAEGGAPMKERFHPATLLEETATFAVRGSDIHAQVRISSDLWEIEADPNQMVQVLSNIIINAVQASPDGGSIVLSAENESLATTDSTGTLPAGDYVKISVQDWGSGIAPEHLSLIFDPFFTTKRQARGLGLAAAYSIVQRHGGHIQVVSTPGQGTTFSIHLPACQTAGIQVHEGGFIHEKDPATGEGSIEASSQERKQRVLVMDDEEPIRDLAETMFEMLGYQVVTVPDGEAAVTYHAEAIDRGEPFDFFVSDLTIPGGMGGRDAIRLIREKDKKLIAIVSSGYSNDPVMGNHLDYGFNGVLPKPYMFNDLVSLMNQLSGVVS